MDYAPLVEVEGIAPSSSRFQQRVLNNINIYYNIFKIVCQEVETAKPSDVPEPVLIQLVPLYTTMHGLSDPLIVASVQYAVAPISD